MRLTVLGQWAATAFIDKFLFRGSIRRDASGNIVSILFFSDSSADRSPEQAALMNRSLGF
ncbi:hypothetical protein LOC67_20595 [Stieleria sp. JC731]|uniref:hypothetical protein n=1 Tax=Stieleria sp. JC731 TaxID=2894195 RepID=UPI001E3BB278|nr:hypothetical protein [Stieleria sp. JC731]MCC9602956.1 hypothetical protein [Stieleria sp. JC731]